MKKTIIEALTGYSLYKTFDALDEIGRDRIEWVCALNDLDFGKIESLRARVKAHSGHDAPEDEIETLDNLVEILKRVFTTVLTLKQEYKN